jgi:hypothetical protein
LPQPLSAFRTLKEREAEVVVPAAGLGEAPVLEQAQEQEPVVRVVVLAEQVRAVQEQVVLVQVPAAAIALAARRPGASSASRNQRRLMPDPCSTSVSR